MKRASLFRATDGPPPERRSTGRPGTNSRRTLAHFIERLRLSSTLSLPLDALTQTFGILAKRTPGWTHAATVLVEEMVADRLPVVILDSLGVWYGLRSSSDGKHEGLPVRILGGRHSDLAFRGTSAAFVADHVFELRQPVVLDLSLFSAIESKQFAAHFCARALAGFRARLHLVIDDANTLFPKSAQKNDQSLSGLLRVARDRGVGVTLVSQYPDSISARDFAAVEVLIAARTRAPEDSGAIQGWMNHHADAGEQRRVMESLPLLSDNEAWICSPEWLGAFQRVTIRARATYDGSRDSRGGTLRPPQSRAAASELYRLRERAAAAYADANCDSTRDFHAIRSDGNGNADSVESRFPTANLADEFGAGAADRLMKTAPTRTGSGIRLAPSASSSPACVRVSGGATAAAEQKCRRGRPVEPLSLTVEEQRLLEQYAQTAAVSPGLALRARIVLACARGLLNGDVARELKTTIQSVGKWRRRFVRHRVDGLAFGGNSAMQMPSRR